jgi:hypothetical protein
MVRKSETRHSREVEMKKISAFVSGAALALTASTAFTGGRVVVVENPEPVGLQPVGFGGLGGGAAAAGAAILAIAALAGSSSTTTAVPD